jgi:hypothetical protein
MYLTRWSPTPPGSVWEPSRNAMMRTGTSPAWCVRLMTSHWFDYGSLEVDTLEYLGESALTPKRFPGLGAGNYHFTPSSTDSVGEGPGKQSSGWTMLLNFDQDVGERRGTFFRSAYASEVYCTFEQRASLCTQIKNLLGFECDRTDFAAWWGDPTNGDLDSEYGLEAYWMIQMAPFIELITDIQTIIGPALDDSDMDWVGTCVCESSCNRTQ